MITNLENYCYEVSRTLNQNLKKEEALINYSQSLFEEVGEFFGIDKKIIFHKHELTNDLKTKLISELGDCFWYITAIAIVNEKTSSLKILNLFDINYPYLFVKQELAIDTAILFSKQYFETAQIKNVFNMLQYCCKQYNFNTFDVLTANVEKLQKRYKEKFTCEESQNRKE